MEFERDAPVTASEMARADTPRIVLQPVHAQVRAEVADKDFAYRNDGNFDFETETTIALPAVQPVLDHPHKQTAIITAVGCAILFGGCMVLLYVLR